MVIASISFLVGFLAATLVFRKNPKTQSELNALVSKYQAKLQR